MEEQIQLHLARPDLTHILENTTPAIYRENTSLFLMERAEYTPEGIRRYYRGAKYPQKGFPYPEAMTAANTAKRALMQMININPLNFLFPKKIIATYVRTGDWVLHNYYRKDEMLSPAPRELKGFLTRFLHELHYDEVLGKIIATIFEIDNMYRMRLEDIASETTKEALLARPFREVRRIMKIGASREETDSQRIRFNRFGTILSLTLLLPHVRKAFRRALEPCSFSNFQYDDADRYWVGTLGGYKFEGITWSERDHSQDPPRFNVTYQTQ